MAYSYKKRLLVTKFNDEKTGKLSREMEEIRKIIGEIAIDDLHDKKFRMFYETDFFMGDFTYIWDKNKNQIAGFLFSTFHTNTTGTSPKYLAKAFHAVKKEYRQTEEPYDRSELYKKYIEFFFYNILLLEIISVGAPIASSWIYKKSLPSKNEIISLIKTARNNLNSNIDLQIEIFAENPTTYSDVCKFNLRHETVKKPASLKPGWLENLSEADLMLESCKLYVEYEKGLIPRPPYLEKTTFTVNTSHNEWLNYFKKPNEYKRFYIWQNYSFPLYAFKIKIPVDPENILNAILAILELKGFNAFNKYVKKNYLVAHVLINWKKLEKKFKIPGIFKKFIKKLAGIK